MHLYLYEEEPELIARHVLLLSVLLDETLPARDRMETLLELHGNVFLRDKTAKYLGRALLGCACTGACVHCACMQLQMEILARRSLHSLLHSSADT